MYKSWRAARKHRQRKDSPAILMIQTVSMCNAACTCCPYPELNRTKAIPHGMMSDELFDRIVDDARHFDLKRVSPYLNNEPFLDPKFASRLEKLKTAFPRAVLHVSTNGSRLEPELWKLVANSINKLHISAQGGVTDRTAFERNFLKMDYEKYVANVSGFLTMVAKGGYRLRAENIAINNVIDFPSAEALEKEIAYWKPFGVGINFGGFNSYSGAITIQARTFSSTSLPVYGCADKDRPIQAMHVLFDGACVLCCNDWTREVVVGNANERSLSDIWNGEEYRRHVAAIYSGRTIGNHMCVKCDQAIR